MWYIYTMKYYSAIKNNGYGGGSSGEAAAGALGPASATANLKLLRFMVEKGPTLESIETLDFMKKQLAAQSLVFNLKDKVFCELFPEVVEEIKQKQKAQDELSNRPQNLPLPDMVPDEEVHCGQNRIQLFNGHAPAAGPNLAGLPQANRHHGLLGGALANLFVIVGLAAFAYTVKYVLRSIAQE